MSGAIDETIQPLSGTRKTIAKRMEAAWEAPVFHLTSTIVVAAAKARCSQVAGSTLSDELIRCAAVALSHHSSLNAFLRDDSIHIQHRINIGLAVATDRGLIVPVLHDVRDQPLDAIANRRRDLVHHAREGGLTSADVAGGTFTISNLGMFGIKQFDALLNVPQVAILAVGAARPSLVMSGGVLTEEEFLDLTLTVDHRAVDGAGAAQFMRTLKEVIEE